LQAQIKDDLKHIRLDVTNLEENPQNHRLVRAIRDRVEALKIMASDAGDTRSSERNFEEDNKIQKISEDILAVESALKTAHLPKSKEIRFKENLKQIKSDLRQMEENPDESIISDMRSRVKSLKSMKTDIKTSASAKRFNTVSDLDQDEEDNRPSNLAKAKHARRLSKH